MDEKYEHNYMVDPPRSHDKVPNKKIVKLGIKITDVLDHKLKGLKVDDAEYYGWLAIDVDKNGKLALSHSVLCDTEGVLVVGAIPEPSAGVLFLFGLSVLALWRRIHTFT